MQPSLRNRSWTKEFPGAVVVSDTEGVILDMNDRAAQAFAAEGGRDLVGRSMLDCHPEPSRSILVELLAHPRINVYTVEKKGARSLVSQAPWYENGRYAGFVEVVLPIPDEIPHFVRRG